MVLGKLEFGNIEPLDFYLNYHIMTCLAGWLVILCLIQVENSSSFKLSTVDLQPVRELSSPANWPFVSDGDRQPGALLRMIQLIAWEIECLKKGNFI